MSVKLLVDNCIFSLSETMQVCFKDFELKLGDAVQCGRVVGYTRKPLPSQSEKWKRDEIECLPTIGRLARENTISLLKYSEIDFEGWRRLGSFPSNDFGNLFSGVVTEQLEAAVECSYFFQMDGVEHLTNHRLVDFCNWLLNLNDSQKLGMLAEKFKLPTSLIKSLEHVDRYRELCEGMPEKQYPDIFHLWSAEVNGIDFFLTIDKKFINSMARKNLDLPCKPISPSALLNLLGVDVRDPFPYQEGVFYSLAGIPIGVLDAT